MEAAVRCVSLSHTYIHSKGPSSGPPSAAPVDLFYEALASLPQQKKHKKDDTSPQTPTAKTPNPQTPNPKPFSLESVSFEVPQGARVLLVGSNGAGKSTLMALIAGQMMPQEGELLVLGRRAFHDSSLASDVCCLNKWWGGDHILDVRLEEIVAPSLRRDSCWGPLPGGPPRGPQGRAPSCSCGKRFFCTAWRLRKLLQLLQVSLDWRVGFLSAGESKRAQLVASLAERRRVYLLDEAAGDLDIVSREMLCRFLLAESQETGSCVVYSTHVFDGLDDWPTHILYLVKGTVASFLPVHAFPELRGVTTAGALFSLVQRWLLNEEANQFLHSAMTEVLQRPL